ncbi:DegV family protein [Solibacillus sp. A46]|uniref:DegV family protein n=1 Tax=Solibacillus faecavium TaxID=2762221 RepID=A0ABR8XUW7_9BACL|nr:DegV family protein [Solibacillus faecavium]MBD8035725.1 DegV family protein [Solibacillus faecavium]
MKTAIVTDSTAYLTLEERKTYNIHMIPLSVNIEGTFYDEEIDITASEFYDRVRGAKEFPKTTQPSVGKFVELFETIGKEYDEIVTIHLSSGISGTFQGAVQASGMVEGTNVYAFDSEVAAYLQGMYVKEAAKLALEGASGEQIIAHLNELKHTMDEYIIVDDLQHLQRGGRLSAAAALIGGLLQVKPILTFENKVIVPFEKIRTRKKAIRRVEEQLASAVEKYGALQAVVIHANCQDEAREWMSSLAAAYPTVDFTLSYFGPVIGTHLGEGAIAMGWIKK